MPPHQKAAVYQGVEQLTAEDCLDIARRKLQRSDLEVQNVTMTTLSDTPVGFLGDHYKLNITVRFRSMNGDEKNKSPETLELQFFVKTMPLNALQTELIDSIGAFQKECNFFMILSDLLRKYRVVGSEVDAAWGPDCYFTGSRVIVLNDLTQDGFRILDNRSIMDHEHCVVMFRTLAKFHASSIVFEEKEGQRLGKPFRLDEAYPEIFKETFWTCEVGNSGKTIVESGIKSVWSLTKLMPQMKRGTPPLCDVVEGYLGLWFGDTCEMVLPSKVFRNVVTHGDLWANNVLFRYDAATGSHPEDARLIDFQLLRYAAPAHDFLTALHLNTDRATRDKHFLELAVEYHSTLAAELGKHGLNVEELVPWSQFEAGLQHYRLLSVLMTCLYFPTTLMPGDVAAGIFSDVKELRKFMLEDRSEAACLCFKTDAIYKQRLSEALEEMAECLANK